MRRRFEESYIEDGMDPIQARKKSMELINFMIWRESDDFKKLQEEKAKFFEEQRREKDLDRREKRLIEEGVDPAEARQKAEEEEQSYERDPSSRPAPRLGPAYSSSSSRRPRANPDPMAIFMGCAIACMLVPFVALVFFVLLALMAGG